MDQISNFIGVKKTSAHVIKYTGLKTDFYRAVIEKNGREN